MLYSDLRHCCRAAAVPGTARHTAQKYFGFFPPAHYGSFFSRTCSTLGLAAALLLLSSRDPDAEWNDKGRGTACLLVSLACLFKERKKKLFCLLLLERVNHNACRTCSRFSGSRETRPSAVGSRQVLSCSPCLLVSRLKSHSGNLSPTLNSASPFLKWLAIRYVRWDRLIVERNDNKARVWVGRNSMFKTRAFTVYSKQYTDTQTDRPNAVVDLLLLLHAAPP